MGVEGFRVRMLVANASGVKLNDDTNALTLPEPAPYDAWADFERSSFMIRRPRTITQKVFVPSASPAEVYEAFVNPKKHAAFTGAAATGSARVGARFTAWDGYINGVHRKLVKGRTIVQDWKTTEWPGNARPSRLEFSFKAEKGGTAIRMVHANVPAEQADSLRQGWIDSYWTPLKNYFGGR